MALLSRFDPPAFLSDYDGIPGQREAWHSFISKVFDWAIKSDMGDVKVSNTKSGTMQFYNPTAYDPGGPLIEQAIMWNAFPKELLRRYGRDRALVEADSLWPVGKYEGQGTTGKASTAFKTTVYRPQDEYCEWRVIRDSNTNKILRVIFTSEPPEYWQALFGDDIPIDDDNVGQFPGDKDRLLALYRELVSPQIELTDLICQADIISPNGDAYALAGHYNPYNKWNTTHGIVHLCAPPNSIAAEIKLGVDATVLRSNSLGEAVVDPDALICCSAYGGPDRNSDPTIGATVNALARLGAMITLPNPVGLYMDHIDLTGWEAPAGVNVKDCVKIARGIAGMIERLVVEVPADSGVAVSDLTIGGTPIKFGSQIAECITVKLVGAATALGSVKNIAIPCVGKCVLDPAYATAFNRPIGVSALPPFGTQPAFADEGGIRTVMKSSVRRNLRTSALRLRA